MYAQYNRQPQSGPNERIGSRTRLVLGRGDRGPHSTAAEPAADHSCHVSTGTPASRDRRSLLNRGCMASLVALVAYCLGSSAVAQTAAFQEGDLYFSQTGGAPFGLAHLDPSTCSPTTIAPGLQPQSFPRYDPFRGVLVGFNLGGSAVLVYPNGTTAPWVVTGTILGSMTARAPVGDGKIYGVSAWGPTLVQVLGYVDQADVFQPVLDPAGSLLPFPTGSSGDSKDLMYCPATNSLVHIQDYVGGGPPGVGISVTWLDLNGAGTALIAPPTILNVPKPPGGGAVIHTRMARTDRDTFVFLYHNPSATVDSYELVELDPATKTLGTFGRIQPPACSAYPSPSQGLGLAFDAVTQRAIVLMSRSTCGGGCFNYELRGFARAPSVVSQGTLVCAMPSYFLGFPDTLCPNPPPWSPYDLFDISSPPLGGTGFCFGDSSGTNCPCFPSIPAGMAGNGCPNSVNPSGAHLGASGIARLSSDSIVLNGSGMPASTALYFQGTSTQGGGSGVVFGDGLSCVGGSLIRLGTVFNNASGASHYPNAGNPSVSVKGLVTTSGHRYYQVWYRNADPSFCSAGTFNLTNGVDVLWVP